MAAVRIMDGFFAIDPHTIPAGTAIIVDAWGVRHDPERYPEPERFQPERFRAEAPAPYTWLALGGGAHRCLSAAFANSRSGSRSPQC
jgi:cytochrome P450